MTNLEVKTPLCGLKREDFQAVIDGKKTDLYFLTNDNGNEIAITNYGGALVAIMVPDKNGKHANIIQGHDNLEDVILQNLIFQHLWEDMLIALLKDVFN